MNEIKLLLLISCFCINILQNTFAKVILGDTIPPVLIGVPSDLTVQCDSIPAADIHKISATDNDDVSVSISFAQYALNTNKPNQIYIYNTWTARDKSGNSSQKTQKITVLDTKAPEIIGTLEDVTIYNIKDFPPLPKMSAKDNCDEKPSLTFVETGINMANGVWYTQTWTAIDKGKNERIRTRKIALLYNTSTEGIDSQLITISPNPSNGIVYIKNAPEDATATIFDLNGRILLSQQAVNQWINVSSLAKGIYLMKITNKEGASAVKKIVKE